MRKTDIHRARSRLFLCTSLVFLFSFIIAVESYHMSVLHSTKIGISSRRINSGSSSGSGSISSSSSSSSRSMTTTAQRTMATAGVKQIEHQDSNDRSVLFKAGQQVQGEVLSIVPHGVLVDVPKHGAALLHVKDISRRYFVSNIEGTFAVGDKIRAWIKFYDTAHGKMGLQMFAPETRLSISSSSSPESGPTALQQQNSGSGSGSSSELTVPTISFEQLFEGQRVRGKVVKYSDFGVYVDIGIPGLMAFLHRRKIKLAERAAATTTTTTTTSSSSASGTISGISKVPPLSSSSAAAAAAAGASIAGDNRRDTLSAAATPSAGSPLWELVPFNTPIWLYVYKLEAAIPIIGAESAGSARGTIRTPSGDSSSSNCSISIDDGSSSSSSSSNNNKFNGVQHFNRKIRWRHNNRVQLTTFEPQEWQECLPPPPTTARSLAVQVASAAAGHSGGAGSSSSSSTTTTTSLPPLSHRRRHHPFSFNDNNDEEEEEEEGKRIYANSKKKSGVKRGSGSGSSRKMNMHREDEEEEEEDDNEADDDDRDKAAHNNNNNNNNTNNKNNNKVSLGLAEGGSSIDVRHWQQVLADRKEAAMRRRRQ